MGERKFHFWGLAASMLIASVVGGIAGPPSRCLAQTNGNGARSAAAAAASQTVYEAGDVYIPGSRVYMLVGKSGLGHEHGVVGQLKQGHVNLNASRDAGMLEFDLGSFAADTPEARRYVGLEGQTDASTQQQVNANMRGPAVLNIAQYPTASFVLKEITPLPQPSKRGLPQYKVAGDFLLHGTTRPLQIVAEAEERGGWIHVRGGFNMLQSQFGIKPFTKALGVIGVADQIAVWGDLWIAKQRQVASRPTVPAR
jgi:polyisoprenoid-binding protein YceI